MCNYSSFRWELLFLALAACSVALPPPPPPVNFTPTQHGVLISLAGRNLEIAVAGPGAFRISSGIDTSATIVPIDTPMLAPVSEYPSFSVVSPTPDQIGIKASFGSLLYDTTAQLLLFTAGSVEFPPHPLFPPSLAPSRHNDTCNNVQSNVDAAGPTRTPSCPNGLKNMTQSSCCAACNSDPDCKYWVLAPHDDVTGHNCWLLSSISSVVPRQDRTMGAVAFPPGPPPFQSLSIAFRSLSALYFGGGGHAGQQLTRTSGSAHVANTDSVTPSYWSTDGYVALAVSPLQNSVTDFASYPASWSTSSRGILWSIQGLQVDLYLAPAASMADASRALWSLISPPPVPPRYAFGFLASRWGWSNSSYIEDMVQQFRAGQFPIDAIISDFEWYTPSPDYSLPDSGSPTFVDFGYNNITFPEPKQQLLHYKTAYNMRFGGIRKPRLGNSFSLIDAKAKGWLVGQGGLPNTSASTRNLNYSLADVRSMYTQQNAHFIQDSVDFWWNDEGETMYFTFHWWNVAEAELLKQLQPSSRFFSINRAYTPGMQRLGSSVWTGDVGVSWGAMQQQPGYLLNWQLAGAGYVTCDIGGFSGSDDPADLLVRWYQVGVFMSIMRVHSTLNDLPHFPFLYPKDKADAMRSALQLRYQLLPHMYSLAHVQYSQGLPIARPLFMEFPADLSVVNTVDQWMSGDALMVTPILTSNDGQITDTQRSVYLPATIWHELRWSQGNFSFIASHKGPATISATGVQFTDMLLFGRAGGIVFMGPLLQYTDALPGGCLQPLVFSGSDGGATLYEDDGVSVAYMTGDVRSTQFTWTDATATLQWSVTSPAYDGPSQYTCVQPTLVDGAQATRHAAVPLGMSGSISFK